MITSITLKPVLFHICLFLTRVTQKILPLVDIDSGLAVGHIPIDDRSPGQQMLHQKQQQVQMQSVQQIPQQLQQKAQQQVQQQVQQQDQLSKSIFSQWAKFLWMTHFKFASRKFQKLIFCHCSVKFIVTMFSLM